LDLQIKLLRALETGSYTRCGSDQDLQANVRVIAATNADPQKAVEEGRLRADLYHLLNVFPVQLPPLRERKGDLALLARSFFAELNDTHATCKPFPPRLIERLARHRWSGNVRELRSFLYRVYILSDDRLASASGDGLDPVSLEIASSVEEAALPRAAVEIAVGTSLADADRQLILATLAECGGVKRHCAKLLGISLKTLYNRLDVYGLGRNRPVVAQAKHPPVPRIN
jgi:DNA-binding NtrC family response regulator